MARRPVTLDLEVSRDQDGRLEGHLRIHNGHRWSPFSGVLELLKVLEDSPLPDLVLRQRDLRALSPSGGPRVTWRLAHGAYLGQWTALGRVLHP
jgi:hypothetical protein